MSDASTAPALVSLTQRLESTAALDPVIRALRPVAEALVADPVRRGVLRGGWLGHAAHPMLTDVPIGMWTSALTLDLVGGAQSRTAARRLVGLGVISFFPTALTGWAEWSGLPEREQRVGVVHAVSNAAAMGLFAASWRARGGGHQARGVGVGLLGASVLGLGGYLGGHLVAARKVASRDPAFEED